MLAFLWCNSCIWEIDQAQLDKPPCLGKPPALSLPWLRWERRLGYTRASVAAGQR